MHSDCYAWEEHISDFSGFITGLAVAGALGVVSVLTVYNGSKMGAEIRLERKISLITNDVRSGLGTHNGDARARAIAVRDLLVENKSPYVKKTLSAIEEGDRCWAKARDLVDLAELLYANDCAMAHYRQAEVLGAYGGVRAVGGEWPTTEL